MMLDGALGIFGHIDSQIELHGVHIEVEGVSNILRHAAVKASNDPKAECIAVTIVAAYPDFGSGWRLQAHTAWCIEIQCLYLVCATTNLNFLLI